jgi:hypothetical protein
MQSGRLRLFAAPIAHDFDTAHSAKRVIDDRSDIGVPGDFSALLAMGPREECASRGTIGGRNRIGTCSSRRVIAKGRNRTVHIVPRVDALRRVQRADRDARSSERAFRVAANSRIVISRRVSTIDRTRAVVLQAES